MNRPHGFQPAFPLAIFLFATALPLSVRAGGDPAPGAKAHSAADPAAAPSPSAPAPAHPVASDPAVPDPAPQRLTIPPRALRLKNRPPPSLKHLSFSTTGGFALRMSGDQEITAEIRNGAGRTLAYTSRALEPGEWTLRPHNLAPGLYTVLLRTGPNLRALRMKIEDPERGQGRPEWVLERVPDSTGAPDTLPRGAFLTP